MYGSTDAREDALIRRKRAGAGLFNFTWNLLVHLFVMLTFFSRLTRSENFVTPILFFFFLSVWVYKFFTWGIVTTYRFLRHPSTQTHVTSLNYSTIVKSYFSVLFWIRIINFIYVVCNRLSSRRALPSPLLLPPNFDEFNLINFPALCMIFLINNIGQAFVFHRRDGIFGRDASVSAWL